MGARSILKKALAANKGVDFAKLKDKKRHKEALRQKKVKQHKQEAAAAEVDEDGWEDEEAIPAAANPHVEEAEYGSDEEEAGTRPNVVSMPASFCSKTCRLT